jgi:hypothetical protein
VAATHGWRLLCHGYAAGMKRTLNVLVLVVALIGAACNNSSSSSSSNSKPSSGGAIATVPTSPSNSSVPVSDYANGVCSAIKSFQTKVKQEEASLNLNTSDIPSLKQSWLTFLNGVMTATESLVTAIQTLGAPDVPGGQQAAAAVNAEFTKLAHDVQTLKAQSETLPTTSSNAFVAEFKPMIDRFKTDMQGFATDLKSAGGGLDAALGGATSCNGLFGSSSGASP